MRFENVRKMLRFCPRTGRFLGFQRQYRWLVWLLPIVGLAALIWFLVRVIPKPSRATYPCQRVAAPLASGFVVWIGGIVGSTLAYRRARRHMQRARYAVAGLLLVVSVLTIWLSVSITSMTESQAAFAPSDPANSPIGVGKGIHPGRVAWVHDPAATSWDGTSGSWWQDANTDQDVVNLMMSRAVRGLTGEPTDADAWDALFRHFNQTRGLGNVGYQTGERIAIKINMNQDSGGNWGSRRGMPSPQAVYALVEQLICEAGVPGQAITLYDASRFIGDPIYDTIRGSSDPELQAVRFVVRPDSARSGRSGAVRDMQNTVHFAQSNVPNNGTTNLPQCVTEAKYLVNFALLRAHSLYGVTVTAKNHFGSVYSPSRNQWTPAPLHDHGDRNRPMYSYNCLVDLIGHEHLGGKTLLYLIDGLYSARNQGSDVIKFESFGNDWCSSLFASQDPVAIDSVALDFLRNEPRATDVTGSVDNYLHEAAMAHNPPSGSFYDPEGDGTRLESLGVHEHWNNAADKQYSRNLGTGDGIELFRPSMATEDGPIHNVTQSTRYEMIQHAVADAEQGDEIVVPTGTWYESIDFGGKSITIRSTDPDDPQIVRTTVISGDTYGVRFGPGHDGSSVLAGLTITAADTGIHCTASSPTIVACNVVANDGSGVELYQESRPVFERCEIAGNKGGGIEMFLMLRFRETVYNYPLLRNCIVAGNLQHGLLGGKPEIANCTIVQNGGWGVHPETAIITDTIAFFNDLGQISAAEATVAYSDIEGGFTGQTNFSEDPCFAALGHWDDNSTPSSPGDDFWVRGDYHLLSQAGRWEAAEQSWMKDAVTSCCVDAGDPATRWMDELWPHGQRVNVGAYGGTCQAAMSLLPAGCKADLNCDQLVNMDDVRMLAAKWLIEQDLLAEDVNRDGAVAFDDFAELAEFWLGP